jgi:hypothetical protein
LIGFGVGLSIAGTIVDYWLFYIIDTFSEIFI